MSTFTTTTSSSGPSTAPEPTTMSATPSATSFIALTTPFVPPPSCGDIWTTTTSVTAGTSGGDAARTVIMVMSNTADPRFAACQPPGWDAVPTESRFIFSPAVCPSDWTAYAFSTRSLWEAWPLRSSDSTTFTSTLHSYTVAHCCARSFTLSNSYKFTRDMFGSVGVAASTCFQDIQATPGAVRAHHAWQIKWAESDVKSLSPPPPALTCRDHKLATWVPGSTDHVCNPEPNRDSHNLGNLIYLVTILPIVVFISTLTCCFFCFRRRRKQRRHAAERTEQAKQDKAQPAPAV
ncbi:hypothetical protein GGTG_11023 [Gaeumannomyces tritici R3-111a-1]|uniref:Uncharacterized protein n=1 Tax=Gaeumannomyces tritici (strain R3-111a-1) TaxID=644352 RepID=J3PBZ9_GAET3|nr:hypothetical protein GGTG_11023 [Gaeumannomyces tritici R3-111a-1]EJT71769.1 hypothetical protein GGTG_11023 [Gaeumannomyces tritici R3-111a-1]